MGGYPGWGWLAVKRKRKQEEERVKRQEAIRQTNVLVTERSLLLGLSKAQEASAVIFASSLPLYIIRPSDSRANNGLPPAADRQMKLPCDWCYEEGVDRRQGLP